ncbi:hypothetical protein [Ruegeria sp. A3M17]|uniref:hypothetical protein n=1 Tax=Ruegeria sp. A3M17 TaxID=2267229 RepID=UPI000DEA6AE9|nr:hypothetical protein [Ruegeria sp. A3M17]RBW52989.1 hypothetical protein DS906_18595 [Ruegeria sp. A3M17]
MTPEDIQLLFTRESGEFLFARWGRPIVPIVFGVEVETLTTVKGAFEAVVSLADHKMAETDPELGANCMVFFFRDWKELLEVPDLDRLVPDLTPLVDRLIAADANQYRVFRFEEDGSIRAAFVFLRMDKELSKIPAETLALSQVVQAILLWSDTAFRTQSPLAVAEGVTVLRPDIAGLIRAAYDPVLPGAAQDPAHGLRLFARMQQSQ